MCVCVLEGGGEMRLGWSLPTCVFAPGLRCHALALCLLLSLSSVSFSVFCGPVCLFFFLRESDCSYAAAAYSVLLGVQVTDVITPSFLLLFDPEFDFAHVSHLNNPKYAVVSLFKGELQLNWELKYFISIYEHELKSGRCSLSSISFFKSE